MKKKYAIQGLLSAGFAMLLLLTGCSNKNNASRNLDIVHNVTQRETAFLQIMRNEDVLTDLMKHMEKDTQAMQWMMQDSSFMDHMFSQHNFDYMMQQNPSLASTMMQNMAGMLGNDSAYMQHWNSMMQGQGHVRGMMNQNR